LRREYLFAQILASDAVAATITGFGAALYPNLLVGRLSFAAAVPANTLKAFLTILPF